LDQTVDTAALFVYGTLLNPVVRARLLGRPIDATPVRLAGYARGQRRYFFIARSEGSETQGALLKQLTARDFEILDDYEEVPGLYTRERVTVLDSIGTIIECWTYLPTDWAK
jgi:gamma-glutamylcyclotransferase (GGCT)/AIG2-like uncharacterized protein YtfP